MADASTDQTWDELFRQWTGTHHASRDEAERWLQVARKRIARHTPDDWRWLTDALADPGRMSFVSSIFKVAPVPRRMLVPMIRAAVLTPSVTVGRFLVVPCVKSLGGRAVVELLLRYLESGTDAEKAGAVSALYYAYDNPRNEDLDDLWERIEGWKLREFIGNPDLDLRRRIIPSLALKPEVYPQELRPLVPVAIDIALSPGRVHPAPGRGAAGRQRAAHAYPARRSPVAPNHPSLPSAHLDSGAGRWFSRSRIRWCDRRVPVRSGDHPPVRIPFKKILMAPCRIPSFPRFRHPYKSSSLVDRLHLHPTPGNPAWDARSEEPARENSVNSVDSV